MNIYGCGFTYAGIKSDEYLSGAPKLIIQNMETSPNTKLCGDINIGTLYNRASNKTYTTGNDLASSQLSFDIEVITEDGEVLSNAQQRAIEQWLFNRHTYIKMYFDDTDDSPTDPEHYTMVDGIKYRFYLNCILMDPERIEGNGGVVGYKCTLHNDSLMLWQDEMTKTFTTSGTEEVISLTINTDLMEYTYPKVYIGIGNSGGDISICNITDDSTRNTTFEGLNHNITFLIDGNMNYIGGDHYQKFSEKNFVRLLNGRNDLRLTGDIKSLEFRWNNRRYF